MIFPNDIFIFIILNLSVYVSGYSKHFLGKQRCNMEEGGVAGFSITVACLQSSLFRDIPDPNSAFLNVYFLFNVNTF